MDAKRTLQDYPRLKIYPHTLALVLEMSSPIGGGYPCVMSELAGHSIYLFIHSSHYYDYFTHINKHQLTEIIWLLLFTNT